MAKAKKYPKAPKKPKASATLAQHEAYHQRVKEWQRKCADIDKEKAEREKAVKKTNSLHSHISGVKRRGR